MKYCSGVFSARYLPSKYSFAFYNVKNTSLFLVHSSKRENGHKHLLEVFQKQVDCYFSMKQMIAAK